MSRATAAAASAATVNVFDPVETARADPYFKRNHMGRVTCTLCNVTCNDEHAFLSHRAGKTHTLRIDNQERAQRKRLRIEEEERLDAQKAAVAEKERATHALLASTQQHAQGQGRSMVSTTTPAGTAGAGADGSSIVAGRFGLPKYVFRIEHDEVPAVVEERRTEGGVTGVVEAEDPTSVPTDGTSGTSSSGGSAIKMVTTTREVVLPYQTRVWLDFSFDKAEEGTRPLHRWMSAHEQHVDVPADDYFVYLIVACDGYTTTAMKFPAKLRRSQEGDALDEKGESVYRCWWDPVRKSYSLFFVLSRRE